MELFNAYFIILCHENEINHFYEYFLKIPGRPNILQFQY